MRRDAFARAIRGSNTIEGYNVTIDDAVAVAEDEEPLDADEETRAAIIGYRDALTYILQLENDPHFEYSAALIRSLHYMMIKYDLSKRPGQWRPGPIRVVDERKKQVVYTGPDADKLPSLMRELISSLNEKDASPAMIRAAMAHLNLTMIHPFSDGNGRMARALQTLVLAREGILSPTFCSIEEYLGRHQDDYYNVLAEVGKGSWHPECDARPWIRFCLLAHYRGATNLLRRTRELQILWDEIELQRKKLGLPERVEVALVTAAFGRRVYNSLYRKMSEISDQVASRDLKKLTDLGLLVPHGEKRGRLYMGSKKLLAARQRLKEIRIEDDPFAMDKPKQPSLPGLSAE
ncbi:MAG TPA: Fic family protein [Stellaceae bacterium]|nr:Fic family protein [Stellaceae bacterium]